MTENPDQKRKRGWWRLLGEMRKGRRARIEKRSFLEDKESLEIRMRQELVRRQFEEGEDGTLPLSSA